MTTSRRDATGMILVKIPGTVAIPMISNSESTLI